MDMLEWKIKVYSLGDVQRIIHICLGLGIVVPPSVAHFTEEDVLRWCWLVGKKSTELRLDAIGEQFAQLERLKDSVEFQLDNAYEGISKWVEQNESKD